MSQPRPPHIQAAQEQLSEALQRVEGQPLDLVKAPWPDVEKGVVKLLGGPFRMDRPEHQMVALGLAGAFAERLMAESPAFWFPNRDALEGAMVGFAEAVIPLSPFNEVAAALQAGQLGRLDQAITEIRRALGQARFQAAPGQQAPRLGPEDYQRLFDPGFLQFVVLDEKKAKQTWESRPDALARDVRDALGRTQPALPAPVRQQFEAQIVGALGSLEAAKPLAEQMERAPRIAELMGHLFAATGGTGSAPEEFWQGIILPLLFIGAPASFPPLDEEELEAFKQGADPLAIFVEVVPYSRRAPEEGLLGAFEMSDVSLPHPAFQRAGAARLFRIDRAKVGALVKDFDAAKTRDAVARFTQYLEQKAGGTQAGGGAAQGQGLLDAAMQLLGDLQRSLAAGTGDLCLRRLTEGEAASEPTLALVRKALQGPRIILTP
jgi:hypothetical protein